MIPVRSGSLSAQPGGINRRNQANKQANRQTSNKKKKNNQTANEQANKQTLKQANKHKAQKETDLLNLGLSSHTQTVVPAQRV